MINSLKNEKGYIDITEIIGVVFILLCILFIIFLIVSVAGNLCFDFASGSHRIIPTAIDNDMYGNYKVYYRTTEYTKNSEEDYYYIDKKDKELAEQMREYIKNEKTVMVYYDKYVGFKGWGATTSAPVTKIEVIE